ncbi:PREDICTED: LOW QUALITY PROTEIN: olfactory receptor 10A2-like [Galeopterus variegatus]|uniref:LOW QUALITY PROTEIN: olfactory receptor 10A2-like n=1 Tax=Galeopterus variegatus TaxID=482537 RepID=A0ABM0RV86_GALVR|nr:PREDICTED: LOW QUALITY PROTEIN: olfactory receptor 10A2-like [Galeopterus variegatus]
MARVTQRPSEDLTSFIVRVEQSIQRKFPPGHLRDQFVKMLVWDGMTADHKLACAGLKDRSMEKWVAPATHFHPYDGSAQYKELLAILLALQKEPDPINLFTDSLYAANLLPGLPGAHIRLDCNPISSLMTQISGSEPIVSGNQSLCTKFTFIAFSSLAELQLVLFIVFLIIYLFTVGGNLIIVCLIWVTPSLHTPMYFFLANLSFLETCYISSVVPQRMVHLLLEIKTISVGGCAAQMYIFTILGLTECCLLAAMAYDRFVAICYPLHYTLLMGPRVCLKLAAASWITGMVVESAQTTWIFTLPFCGTGKIQHFFCDIIPVVKLACVDTSRNEVVLFAVSMLFIMGPCLLILCSYMHILVTILRIPSAAGKQKAFSTCSSHILVVSLFYGTALFTYLQPKTVHTPETDKATALMYTVVTPALNPVIYTLRNKEVKEAFQRVTQKNAVSQIA